MRLSLSLLLLALPGLACGAPANPDSAQSPSPSGSRPNVLFILTDDLGYGDIGVFYQNQRKAAGQPCELTPNLDAMAAQGIQLRDHYTSAPVCAPARGTLLAGVTQGHAGVRNNQFDKALEDNHTLATVLKGAGYATVAIGKWGLQGAGETSTEEDVPKTTDKAKLGNPSTWPAYPTKRGFDYYFGYVRHSDGHEHYPTGIKQVWDMDKEISGELQGCYTADLWTARAKKWIVDQQAADPKKPFFMYLAYDTPHAVLEYPTMAYPRGGGLNGGLQWLGQSGQMINTASGTRDSYCYPAYAHATYVGRSFGGAGKGGKDDDGGEKSRPWPDVCKRYATSVQRIDDCVGDLLQLLRDLHIDENTIVIFTSDNGPSDESYLHEGPGRPNFLHSFGPFDGIKRDCWEGGIREGAIVRWPGTIPAGRVDETPSQFQDWMPTLADVAGIAAPARTDGVSLVPTLTGQPGQKPSLIYSEYFYQGKTPSYPEFAPSHRGRVRGQMQLLRVGDFVGVRYNIKNPAAEFEIFDIAHDPQEIKNLASEKPDLEKQMQETVLQVRRPDPSAARPYDNERVPPNEPGKTVPGIQWQATEQSFPWLPKVEFLPVSTSGTGAAPEVSLLPRKDDVAMLYSGFLNVPQDGSYTLSLAASGKALLRIHDATVIDEDFGYTGGARTGEIKLKAGRHAFRLYYMPAKNAVPSLDLEWGFNGAAPKPIPAATFSRPAS